MRHVISMLVENHKGVLARISGLLSGRGYNVESITAGLIMDPSVSRITLVCTGDDAVVEQIKKQLNRLIDVISVTELTDAPSLNRELMLVKVNASGSQRGEVFQVADVFKAQIMDVGFDTMSVELAGSPVELTTSSPSCSRMASPRWRAAVCTRWNAGRRLCRTWRDGGVQEAPLRRARRDGGVQKVPPARTAHRLKE